MQTVLYIVMIGYFVVTLIQSVINVKDKREYEKQKVVALKLIEEAIYENNANQVNIYAELKDIKNYIVSDYENKYLNEKEFKEHVVKDKEN